jgi:magnesium-transporting ATPase (P-type)
VSADGGSLDSRGLSDKEAAARLKADGLNTLPQADRRTFIWIVLEILREPMFALLLGAAVIVLQQQRDAHQEGDDDAEGREGEPARNR